MIRELVQSLDEHISNEWLDGAGYIDWQLVAVEGILIIASIGFACLVIGAIVAIAFSSIYAAIGVVITLTIIISVVLFFRSRVQAARALRGLVK